MRRLLVWLNALAELLDPERRLRRETHERRSAGAKKGWAKRKAKPEVPHDVQ
jgi:hypothetical protein